MMRKLLAGLGGTTGGVIAGAVAVAALGAAWLLFGPPQNAAPDAPQSAAAPAPVAPGVAAERPQDPPVATASQDGSPDVTPAISAPAFDEVRREADGMTVIAGRGAAQASIVVLLDGDELATARADDRGKFATLVMIPPGGTAHVLSLLQRAEGAEQASADQIFLAPLAAPVTPAPDVIAQAAEPDALPPEPAEQVDDSDASTTQTSPVTIAETPDPAVSAPSPNNAEGIEGDTPSKPARPVVTAETSPPPEPSAQTQAETTEPPTSAPGPAVQAQTSAPEPIAPVAELVGTAQTPRADPETALPSAAVPAPAAVAVLRATPEGVELLNPQVPEVMENIALDTISYSQVGAVQLSGRAQSETQAVRVYLDNDAIISLPVDDAGRWRGDLPDVAEGIYTLRVDEVAADGSVTSRVETPFKREAPAVLAAAAAAQDGPIKAITVQKGATLWAIARDRYGSGALFVRVFEANAGAIRDPDLIYPGQVFDLPD